MKITTHQLAQELLAIPDRPVAISMDVSTCDDDARKRAFGGDYFGINDKSSEEIMILFVGEINF